MLQLLTSLQSSQSTWKLNQRRRTITHSSQSLDKSMVVSRPIPKTRFTKLLLTFSAISPVATTMLCKLHSFQMTTNTKSRLSQSIACLIPQEISLTTSHKQMLDQFFHQFHAFHSQNAASLEWEETEIHHILLSADNNRTLLQKWHHKELEPRTSNQKVTRKKKLHQANSWRLPNQLVHRACFQELLQRTQLMCTTFIMANPNHHLCQTNFVEASNHHLCQSKLQSNSGCQHNSHPSEVSLLVHKSTKR